MAPFNRARRGCFAAVSGCAVLIGCATPAPAPLQHIVLIKLHDPSQAEALIAESHRRLRPIPFIADYTCGRHLDTGRPSVDGSYDVGLIVSFRTPADYRAYLDHPDHTAMVSEWRPRWESARIYDVLGSDR